MVLRAMNKWMLYSSLCMIFGGAFAIIPVLPLISNLFPIYTYYSNADLIGTSTGSVSFWGIRRSTVSHLPKPSGWTPLGISPLILIFIFTTLGIIGIILSINSFLNFLPSHKVLNIPITSIIGIITGLIILFFDLLIFLGNANDYTRTGLSGSVRQQVATLNVIPGIGYWFLVLSGLAIIAGSILNGISGSNWMHKIFSENTSSITSSSNINQFLDEIDDIIQETKNSSK